MKKELFLTNVVKMRYTNNCVCACSCDEAYHTCEVQVKEKGRV